MSYTAPLREMRFAMDHMADLAAVAALPGCEEATPDLVDAVLGEAGRLASNVLAPLNRVGDTAGSIFENGVVRAPEGFPRAWRQFSEGGWHGLPFGAEYGGQGLPWLLANAVQEMWQGSNMSFGLAPLLLQGVVVALEDWISAEDNLRLLEAIGSTHVQVYYDARNIKARLHDPYGEPTKLKGRIQAGASMAVMPLRSRNTLRISDRDVYVYFVDSREISTSGRLDVDGVARFVDWYRAYHGC